MYLNKVKLVGASGCQCSTASVSLLCTECHYVVQLQEHRMAAHMSPRCLNRLHHVYLLIYFCIFTCLYSLTAVQHLALSDFLLADTSLSPSQMNLILLYFFKHAGLGHRPQLSFDICFYVENVLPLKSESISCF